MSSDRIAGLIGQLILAIFLIFYGFYLMFRRKIEEEKPFAGYQNLEDCISKNWNKRDPEQYCRKIKSKVETARRRKYGRI